MILSCGEMKALEERAFAAGITAEALMEEAGRKIAEAIRQFHRFPGRCIVVFGKGHNGGDALVAARYLAQAGWTLEWKPAFPEETWAPLTRKNWQRVDAMPTELDGRHTVLSGPGPRPLIILDGLLGIGAGGALRDRSARRRRRSIGCGPPAMPASSPSIYRPASTATLAPPIPMPWSPTTR